MLTVLAMPCHCQGPSHLVVILMGDTGFQGPLGNDKNIFGGGNWRKKYTSSFVIVVTKYPIEGT